MEEKTALQKMTDGELIALVHQKNTAACDELILRYSSMVRASARRFFLSMPEAEELIQEGMLGLFAAVNSYDIENEKGASFKTFASVCVRRKINDAMKKRKSENGFVCVPLFDVDEASKQLTPEEEFIENESREEFMRTISGALSDYEFRALVYYVDGMSYGEIARLTKKPEKSVGNALQRARKKLQELLKK